MKEECAHAYFLSKMQKNPSSVEVEESVSCITQSSDNLRHLAKLILET
jgi:hypothetical protein